MGLNILVVDDSATMRSMVKKTIKMSGIPIACLFDAGNGKEGLEVLDKEWIDLVLIDLNMPVMGGIEMINRLRNIPEHAQTPVVVISTESSNTRIEEIQRKGIPFIHKPFTPEHVIKVIRPMLGDLQDACDQQSSPGSSDAF